MDPLPDIDFNRHYFHKLKKQNLSGKSLNELETLRDEILKNKEPLESSIEKKDIKYIRYADDLIVKIDNIFKVSKFSIKQGFDTSKIIEDYPQKFESGQLKKIPLDPKKSGNKAANLYELESISKEFMVPDYISIIDEEIQTHLSNYYPKLDEDWSRFALLKEEIKGIPKEAEEILRMIEANIEAAFSNNIFSSPALNDLIRAYENSGLRFMVRSSGLEDSPTLANAGANYSESNVPPNSEAISSAMGRVVASYYAPFSLTQLEILGQDILKRPFAAVLTQLMIGEVDLRFEK